MRRRELIALIAGTSLVYLSPVKAQNLRRRIVLFSPIAATDSEAQTRYRTFLQALMQKGWVDGHNIQIEYRWGAGNINDIRRHAGELVALSPDVILATGASTVAPLLQATQSIPIVFVVVPDPVGAGFVDSLSRPGGNTTGFIHFEYGMTAKWIELLKQIAPRTTRAAVLRDPNVSAGIGQFGAIQAVAPSLGVEAIPFNVRTADEIERTLIEFSRIPNGGLIVTGSALAIVHREVIIKLAARHKLPAIYFERLFANAGGLMTYGPDLLEQYERAAGYVDRILSGEKPANLPVQAPTKYDLVINLKAAKALGLTVPADLSARANEVIE